MALIYCHEIKVCIAQAHQNCVPKRKERVQNTMLALLRREEDVGKVSAFSRHIYMGYEPGLIMYKLFI